MATKTLEQCPQYDKCKSPICPLDPSSTANSLWYPGEQICVMRGAPAWVKTQRKVAKKATDASRFFKAGDLLSMRKVRKPEGHRPDEMAWDKVRPNARRTKQLALITSG